MEIAVATQNNFYIFGDIDIYTIFTMLTDIVCMIIWLINM